MTTVSNHTSTYEYLFEFIRPSTHAKAQDENISSQKSLDTLLDNISYFLSDAVTVSSTAWGYPKIPLISNPRAVPLSLQVDRIFASAGAG